MTFVVPAYAVVRVLVLENPTYVVLMINAFLIESRTSSSKEETTLYGGLYGARVARFSLKFPARDKAN